MEECLPANLVEEVAIEVHLLEQERNQIFLEDVPPDSLGKVWDPHRDGLVPEGLSLSHQSFLVFVVSEVALLLVLLHLLLVSATRALEHCLVHDLHVQETF